MKNKKYPQYTKRVTLSLAKKHEPIFEKVKKFGNISAFMWGAAEDKLKKI